MQSTIDDFYRKRKLSHLPVSNDISPSKRTARKLFPDINSSAHRNTPSSKEPRALLFNQFKLKNAIRNRDVSVSLQDKQSVTCDTVTSSTINLAAKMVTKELCDVAPDYTSTADHIKLTLVENSTSSAAKNTLRNDKEDKISRSENAKFNKEKQSPASPASFAEKEVILKPSTPTSRSTLKRDDEFSTPARSPISQIKLQKELHLGEYKNVVRQSKRYTTLKEHIDKFNETLASFKETEKSLNDLFNSPKLEKFHTVEFEITSPVKRGLLKQKRLFGAEASRSPLKNSPYVSPSKLLAEGPVKSPIKPTFERYSHLIAAGKDPLVLPQKYLILKEMFHWIETILKIWTDRGELVTFKKIKREIQRIIKKNFTEEHLGKIISIYQGAYQLSQQPVKSSLSCNESYELVISKPEDSTDSSERQKIFYNLLLDKTKLHHRVFLETLDPPLIIPTDRIKRWHPEFQVENVPDVEPAPIPQPPVTKGFPMSSKNVLEKTREVISSNKLVERSISSVIDEKVVDAQKSGSVSSQTSYQPIPALQEAVKGISQPLLDKIRAKQAAKIAQVITRSAAETKEVVMLSRLPDLAKILRIVFVSEKKGILPEDVVVDRVGHSFKEKMPRKDLVEHLQLISKHVPGWMNFCIVRNISYIRLSKDADMTRITGKLKKLTSNV